MRTESEIIMELSEIQRKTLVRVVDDDPQVRESLSFLLKVKGWDVQTYPNAEEFLSQERFSLPGCLILDIRMLTMSGLELQMHLERNRISIPIIFITAHGEIDSAVHTMKHGAVDFIQKPIDQDRLDKAILKAVAADLEAFKLKNETQSLRKNFESLTTREKQVLELVSKEQTNKEIAKNLNISQRTVEMYRSSGFDKLCVKSVLQLANALKKIKSSKED